MLVELTLHHYLYRHRACDPDGGTQPPLGRASATPANAMLREHFIFTSFSSQNAACCRCKHILNRETCIVNTISMIRVKLREAMDAYRQRTGIKLTYELLAEQTGIALTTLQSLAARPGYNTRLSTIEKLCVALQCSPGDLLEMPTDSEKQAPT